MERNVENSHKTTGLKEVLEELSKNAIRTAVLAAAISGAHIITTENAHAQGAEVTRATGGLVNVDNPCTLIRESVNYSGSLQFVRTPSGNNLFRSRLTSLGSGPRSSIRFVNNAAGESQALITQGTSSNFSGRNRGRGFTFSCSGR
jgi:hypothetical protein